MTLPSDAILDLLPSKGLFAVVGFREAEFGSGDAFKIKTYADHIWLDAAADDISERLEGAIAAHEARGARDIYWSPASFEFEAGVPKRRNANLAAHFRSYYVDMDCHGGEGDYQTPREALEHLYEICDKVDLPPSAVFFSGRGVQAYWTVDSNISDRTWSKIADGIWSIAQFFGLKADPSCRMDRARIMRMPGTFNSKAGTYSKVLVEDDLYGSRDLLRKIEKVIGDYDIPPAPMPERPDAREASLDGSVYRCQQNEMRLAELFKHIPPVFDYETGGRAGKAEPLAPESGYQRWRNAIWGAKATGLANAWDVVYEWAHTAPLGRYDDLDEAIERVWESDNASGSRHRVGPGTLVMLARQYATRRSQSLLNGFHFLEKEDADLIEGCPDYDWADEDYDPFGHQIIRETEDLDARGDLEIGATDVSDDSEPDLSKRYGGRDGVMPWPFVRKEDSPGVFLKEKLPGSEPDENGNYPMRLVPISDVDFELLNVIVESDTNGMNQESSIEVRYYMAASGEPRPAFLLSSELLGDTAALAKRLIKAGMKPPATLPDRAKWANAMGRYLLELREQYDTDGRSVDAVKQLGWQENGSFALGSRLFTAKGERSVALDSSLTARELGGGYGVVGGTLEGQRQLLDLYKIGGNETPQAVLAMLLGAPLTKFAPTRGGVIFLADDQTGMGKTFTQNLANSFYGRPSDLHIQGESTLRSLEVYMAKRNSLSTVVDDMTAGSRPEDQKSDTVRQFFLQASQGKERSRATRSGTGFASGSSTWTAPICVSTNTQIQQLMPDSGSAAKAAYARVMVINTRGAMRHWGPDARVGGLMPMAALNTHYGHIGPLFIQYVIDNLEDVQMEINSIYSDLEAESGEKLAPQHRFHNSIVACGLVALRWLKDAGHVPSWDEQAIEDRMVSFRTTMDIELESLASNNPQVLMTRFLQKNSGTVLKFDQQRTAFYPEQGRLYEGFKIRLEEYSDTAYIVHDDLKKYVTSQGVSWLTFLTWLRSGFQAGEVTSAVIDMAAGITRSAVTAQRVTALKMPLSALRPDDIRGSESEKQEAGSNVVTLRRS